MNDNLDVRRLRRSNGERILAGVCGGLAEFFSVDPNLIRLVFVITSFFGGAGLLIYVIGWVLVPEAGESSSIAQRMARQLQETRHQPDSNRQGWGSSDVSGR